MNKYMLIAILLALSISVQTSGTYKKKNGVIILTDKNFQQAMEEFPRLFVKFYAPWCPHCKKIAPKWEKLAQEYAQKEDGVVFAKMNAEKNPDTGNDQNIQGYPTLKLFNNGIEHEYNGHPTPKKLKKFIEKKTGPVSTEITSDEVFNTLNDKELAIAYFGDNDEDYRIFEKLASKHEDVSFYHSFDTKYYQLNNQVRVTMFKKFNGGKVDFLEPYAEEPLEKWILIHRYEPIQSIEEQSTIERIFTHQTPTVLFFSKGEPDLDGTDAAPFVYSSQHHHGNAAFVTVNIDGETGGEMADYFSIEDPKTLMAIVPVGEEDVDKYMYTGAWNNEDVKNWVQAFLDGKLEKHFKSEEIPEINNAPVKILVGKNYEQFVHNPNSHVLVEFYAPWCHHCKKMAKPFLKLAKDLSYFGEELVIAKIDGTKNEVPGIVVEGFPTLYYYPKGEKSEPIHYNGRTTYKSMKKFLKKKMGSDWRDN